MKKIIITGDQNKGDIISKISDIDDTIIATIHKFVQELKNFVPYTSNKSKKFGTHTHSNNFPFGDVFPNIGFGEKTVYDIYVASGKLTKSELDTILEYIPYGNGGIRSIESIEILECVSQQKLL